MIKIKRVCIEIIKLIFIFVSTIFILTYGMHMMQTEYQERLREHEPQKAAEQVGIFNFFLN